MTVLVKEQQGQQKFKQGEKMKTTQAKKARNDWVHIQVSLWDAIKTGSEPRKRS